MSTLLILFMLSINASLACICRNDNPLPEDFVKHNPFVFEGIVIYSAEGKSVVKVINVLKSTNDGEYEVTMDDLAFNQPWFIFGSTGAMHGCPAYNAERAVGDKIIFTPRFKKNAEYSVVDSSTVTMKYCMGKWNYYSSTLNPTKYKRIVDAALYGGNQ